MDSPSATPETPTTATSGSGAASILSVFVGLCALMTVAFFALAGVAVWHRAAHAAAPRAAPQAPVLATVPAASRPAAPARRQAVVDPNGYAAGAVRALPDASSTKLAELPAGTTVETRESATGPGKQGTPGTWYHITTSLNGRPVDGWMHSNILRF